MSVSFAVTEKVVIDGSSLTKTNTLSAGQRISIDEAIAVGTDTLVALTVDVSQVKAVFITSDKAVTLETNNSGTPADTLALAADIPYVWYTGKEDSLVFASDITAIYVTNASGATANLKIEILVDPTV